MWVRHRVSGYQWNTGTILFTILSKVWGSRHVHTQSTPHSETHVFVCILSPLSAKNHVYTVLSSTRVIFLGWTTGPHGNLDRRVWTMACPILSRSTKVWSNQHFEFILLTSNIYFFSTHLTAGKQLLAGLSNEVLTLLFFFFLSFICRKNHSFMIEFSKWIITKCTKFLTS